MLSPTMEGVAGKQYCADPDAPAWGHCGGDVQCGAGGASRAAAAAVASRGGGGLSAAPPEVWVLVDVKAKSGNSVSLDLSKLNGATPIALRYAWDNEKDSCCQSTGPTTWCEPAACPIFDTKSGLPGNPFIARIEGGKCKCVAPQSCDEAVE